MALSVGKPWHKKEICLASELLSMLGAEFRGFWFPVWEGAKKRSVGHGVWKKKDGEGRAVVERLGSGVCRERWVSLERGGKSHRHGDEGRPGGKLVRGRRQISLRAGEGEGERAGFGRVGAWRVLALTVPKQQREPTAMSCRLGCCGPRLCAASWGASPGGRTTFRLLHPRSAWGKGCCSSSSGKREVWADQLRQPE